MNRVKTILTKIGATVINSLSYTYDENGNIETETRNSVITTYTYDSLNRLKTVEYGDGNTITYEYDSRNNIEKEYDTLGNIKVYSYDSKNRLIRVMVNGNVTDEYTYTDNGEVLTHNNTSYAYDEWNRLSSFTDENGTTHHYKYDVDGLRTQKDNTKYITDLQGRVIAETDENGNATAQIIHGHKPLARKMNGQWYYYVHNAHGDVIGMVDQNGEVKNSYFYDAWGKIRNKTEAVENPIQYCGEYFDTETGNIYLRARYYDPGVGRFISEDTYWNPSNMIYGDSGNGGVPSIVAIMQSSNLYAYCINNPIKYTDPTGHVLPGDKEEFGENSDTYKILVDLGNRWNAAKTQAEENALHNLANEVRRLAREGTPIQYAQDKVMNQLHENAKIATNYQKSLIEGWQGILYSLSGGNYYEDSVTFLIGMAYGEWNYKYNPNWQVPYDVFDGKNMNVDNNRNWIAWMYFDGMLMAGDDFGNLNMAYVGYKMGLGTYVYQNFLTTDGKDAFWVQYGIDLAKSGR